MTATSLLRRKDPIATACPPASADVVTLNRPTCSRRDVRRGETLCGAGDSFRMLYVVRSGTFKSYIMSDDGLIQVTGFQISGDMIGLDGIGTGHHQEEVVALEDAEAFVLPFAQCEQWSRESARGQRMMMRTLGREIVRSQEHMLILGAPRAEQRIAVFLLDLSLRYGRLGYSRSQFMLRMTRQDIGSYLGLTLETVSRLLSRFQREGVLQVQGKSVALLDFSTLLRLAGLSSNGGSPAIESIIDRKGNFPVAN